MVDGRFKKGLSGLFTEVEHLKSKENKTVYKILQVPIMLAIPPHPSTQPRLQSRTHEAFSSCCRMPEEIHPVEKLEGSKRGPF